MIRGDSPDKENEKSGQEFQSKVDVEHRAEKGQWHHITDMVMMMMVMVIMIAEMMNMTVMITMMTMMALVRMVT